MTKLVRRLALIFCLSSALSAQAHEFWINPVPNPMQVGDTAKLTLAVGEFFQGDTLAFAAPQTTALRQYSAAGVRDLAPLLALRATFPVLAIPLLTAGTQMVIFDSQPQLISLPAESFHAYLRDEGLDFIKTARIAAGTATQPGRERYRRFVKTLVRADSTAPPLARLTAQVAPQVTPDLTYAVQTGQRLELMPRSDPLAMLPGDTLGLQVLFDGTPLAGALVKAWNKGDADPSGKREGQTVVIRTTTSADGHVGLTLPYAGPWMVSVVHMVAAVGVKNTDWDSLWGSLSFSVAQPALAPQP